MVDLSNLLEEAKDLEVQGKYKEALDSLSDLIVDAQQSSDPILANLLNNRGIVRRMLRQYDESLTDYESALGMSESDEQKAFSRVNIADIQRVAKSDFPAAHCSIDEALTYYKNGSLMHAKAVDQRGLVFIAQEDYSSAIETYKTARNICEDLIKSNLGDKDLENRFGQIVHHLGVAYLFLNEPEIVDEAYESQVTALNTFVKLGDQQGIVNAVATIGKIGMIKKDYDEAIKQYERAYEILSETKYGRAITSLALDLAEANLQKGDTDRAIPYLVRFRDDILNQEVTNHDIQLMKDQFQNLYSLYASRNVTVDKFEQVTSKFE